MEDREMTSVMMDVTTAITPEQRGRQRLTGDTMYLQTESNTQTVFIKCSIITTV